MHVGVEGRELSLPKSEEERRRAVDGEVVWSIVRHFISGGSGARSAFQTTFDANKRYLQEFVTEGKVGGGWRLDREKSEGEDGDGEEKEKEEFVVVAPWRSEGQHGEFAGTEGFKEYGRIREHIGGAEIVHVRLLDI